MAKKSKRYNAFKLRLSSIFKRMCQKIKHYLKDKRILSLLVAFSLIVLNYITNNWSLLVGESLSQYTIIHYIIDKTHIHKSVDYGNIICYNTSYDKELVPAFDPLDTECLDTIGVTAITDRSKILQFLDLLDQSNRYDFIILDIFFDKNDVTQIDDSLYAKIRSMKRIVLPNDENIELPDGLSEFENTALASYKVTDLNTNVVRYQYTEDDKRSIPMFVFENKHPDKIMKRCGFLYFSGGKLCQNSVILTFDNSKIKKKTAEIQDMVFSTVDFPNIGEILNNTASNEERISEIGASTDGKIVVIGDMTNDLHDSYMGKISGGIVLSRALQMLEEEKNIVRFWPTLFWFIIFFIISREIIMDKPLSEQIPVLKKIPYRFVHMLISVMGYTIVLLICSSIEYVLTDRIYSLVIPLLVFCVMKLIVQYSKLDKI